MIPILALGFIVGCVTAEATMLANESYEPVPVEEVTIYLSVDDIPGEFEKIAIINAQGSSTMTKKKQMYEKAREKAAEVGANGVLVGEDAIDEPSTGAEIAGAVLGTGSTREGEMIAIRVLETE